MQLVHLCKELDDGKTILVLHEDVSRETSVKAIRVIINITV